MVDLYRCCECIRSLKVLRFEEGSANFEKALRIAEQEWSQARPTKREGLARDLFIRRAFVRAARQVRDDDTDPVEVDPADEARFELEKAEVRRVLGAYAMSTDRGIGWDPARWKLAKAKLLPQTCEYSLTLADMLLRSQDDALREVFSKQPANQEQQ